MRAALPKQPWKPGQPFYGTSQYASLKDTSPLKPPAGSDVAIIEFAALDAPRAAHAQPIVTVASEHFQVPLVFHDFPGQMSKWSRTGAIYRRMVSAKLGVQAGSWFLRDLFASQQMIACTDDLQNFTERWLKQHGTAMPYVIDPGNAFAAGVSQDCQLAQRIGLLQLATVFVVTQASWQLVVGGYGADQLTSLYQVVQAAKQSVAKPIVPRPAIAGLSGLKA